MGSSVWAVALVVSSGSLAEDAGAFASEFAQAVRSAPLLHVVLETRLADGADAERVELRPEPVRAGTRYVLDGRLARVLLVATRWEGDRWLVRYRIEPRTDAGRRAGGDALGGESHSRVKPTTGTFQLEENSRSEFWTGAPGPLHGLRIQLGDSISGAHPPFSFPRGL